MPEAEPSIRSLFGCRLLWGPRSSRAGSLPPLRPGHPQQPDPRGRPRPSPGAVCSASVRRHKMKQGAFAFASRWFRFLAAGEAPTLRDAKGSGCTLRPPGAHRTPPRPQPQRFHSPRRLPQRPRLRHRRQRAGPRHSSPPRRYLPPAAPHCLPRPPRHHCLPPGRAATIFSRGCGDAGHCACATRGDRYRRKRRGGGASTAARLGAGPGHGWVKPRPRGRAGVRSRNPEEEGRGPLACGISGSSRLGEKMEEGSAKLPAAYVQGAQRRGSLVHRGV